MLIRLLNPCGCNLHIIICLSSLLAFIVFSDTAFRRSSIHPFWEHVLHEQSIKTSNDDSAVPHPPRTLLPPAYIMPRILEPSNSAESIDEESQNHELDLQSTWQKIEDDEDMMTTLRRVIKEIGNSKDNLPKEINVAAKAVLNISSRIDAIIISLCLLAHITNPLLSRGYRITRRISSGL